MPTGHMRPDGSGGYHITLHNNDTYFSDDYGSNDDGCVKFLLVVLGIFVTVVLIMVVGVTLTLKAANDRTELAHRCNQEWNNLSDQEKQVRYEKYHNNYGGINKQPEITKADKDSAKAIYVDRCEADSPR